MVQFTATTDPGATAQMAPPRALPPSPPLPPLRPRPAALPAPPLPPCPPDRELESRVQFVIVTEPLLLYTAPPSARLPAVPDAPLAALTPSFPSPPWAPPA